MLNSKSFICAFALIISSTSLSLMAESATMTAPSPASTINAPSTKSNAIPQGLVGTQDFPITALDAAAVNSMAWLNILDRNGYGESWDQASNLTKLTAKKDEWVKILENTRRPLGSVTSRQVLDERTALDPSGMPKGKYIVMLYKTVFSHKTGNELVTLIFEDGKWTVLTYQVSVE